jgi:DNA-binding CsgD family transcriptional regulator
MPGLSPREHKLPKLLASGYVHKKIAKALGISVPTVNTHSRRVCEKLHVRFRALVIARYVLASQQNRPEQSGL